jgi:hypothetical protein
MQDTLVHQPRLEEFSQPPLNLWVCCRQPARRRSQRKGWPPKMNSHCPAQADPRRAVGGRCLNQHHFVVSDRLAQSSHPLILDPDRSAELPRRQRSGWRCSSTRRSRHDQGEAHHRRSGGASGTPRPRERGPGTRARSWIAPRPSPESLNAIIVRAVVLNAETMRSSMDQEWWSRSLDGGRT